MIEKNRNKTWRQDQIRQFGARLTWARRRVGFAKGSDAIKAMQDNSRVPMRTYYSHEAGQRVPDNDEVIELYCSTFKVSRDFLLFGNGPERDEYLASLDLDEAGEINQAFEAPKVRPSQFGPVRYIPVLTASEVRSLFLGQWDLTSMSGDHLPVPQHLRAGPRSFVYQIPADDRSMVSVDSTSFLPGTPVLIDPDEVIMPDKFMLVQPANWPAPILRQLHSSFPYVPAEPRFPLTLRALNPAFQPIVVENDGDCQIFGRAIFAFQSL